MSQFTIMADAFSDLDEEKQARYDVKVIPSHITLPGGKQILSFHKWDEFDKDEFYAKLKADPMGFSTSPPNLVEFSQAYEREILAGNDILMICISAGISGTYNFAVQAANDTLKKYPKAKIRVVDSRRFGPSIGLLASYASKKRAEGLSMDEVADYIEINKNRLHQAGWLDDLSFVAKKGRMTHAKAFFGTLAGVKPIGEFDYNGLTTVIGKAKGVKAAYELLLKYIENTIEEPENQTIVIAHTNRLEQAKAYRDMIAERFKPREIYISEVFPMCSISIGPGLMAAYYMGSEISQGLEKERAIIEKCQNNG